MKKLIYTMAVISLLSLSLAPVSATNVDVSYGGDEDISTGFTHSDGGGEPPVIKVKWEMNNNKDFANIETTDPLDDDSCTSGAQFMPTGEWDTYKHIYVCAIAMDPDGTPDGEEITVYADIYYPETIKLGACHDELGCGGQHGYEIMLTELTKQQGIELFCNNVRTNHYFLPEFRSGYNYDEICAQDGELMKETARVYCKYTDLKWEDPAGMYEVIVHATDKAGKRSLPLENEFEYLPLTAFEADFTSVNYGNVKQDTYKIINGDLNFGTSDLPTVRNVGNTRLSMTIWQDDMGLGQTTNGSTWWNVEWDARVGSDAQFTIYWPYEDDVVLNNILDLSCTDEMDFSIEVSKFPLDSGIGGEYSGEMVLGAVYADFEYCQG